MTREELDAIVRVTFARAQARTQDTLNEFRSREMGHVDAETLIEAIRGRLLEDFAMMTPDPDGRRYVDRQADGW